MHARPDYCLICLESCCNSGEMVVVRISRVTAYHFVQEVAVLQVICTLQPQMQDPRLCCSHICSLKTFVRRFLLPECVRLQGPVQMCSWTAGVLL
jgi:hypothetical protein